MGLVMTAAAQGPSGLGSWFGVLRRRAAQFVGALSLSAAALWGGAAEARPVLVELYTSQGCYLCPKADALLGEVAQRPDVVGLSLNVDYWDYIGWKDTLALPENKARQTAYAQSHNETAIGTPHMVVHGMRAMAGGNDQAVKQSIEAAAAGEYALSVTLTRAGDALEIAIAPLAGGGADAAVMIAPYRQAVTQAIDAGENAGETLTYHNAALSIGPVGAYSGEATTLSAALPAEADGVAVWVQLKTAYGPVGEILGAAKTEW